MEYSVKYDVTCVYACYEQNSRYCKTNEILSTMINKISMSISSINVNYVCIHQWRYATILKILSTMPSLNSHKTYTSINSLQDLYNF